MTYDRGDPCGLLKVKNYLSTQVNSITITQPGGVALNHAEREL
jgi:hypothetical protein